MASSRKIYQVENIYVGPSPATGFSYLSGTAGYTINNRVGTKVNADPGIGPGFTGLNLVFPLYRIQSYDNSVNIARTDVNQFGELAAIDRIILEQPTVNLNFNYLAYSLHNERLLGFTISSGSQVSAISGILNKTEDEKNYWVKSVPEGNDVVGYTTKASEFAEGFGNGFITNYTAEGSVGNFPTVSLSVEALNYKIDNPATGYTPAINPTDGSTITNVYYALPGMATNPTGTSITYSALRPGDVVVDLSAVDGTSAELGADINDLKIQSYSISFDLARTPLQKLGSKYAFSKEINFPVTVQASFTAQIGDLQTGNLVNAINDDSNFNVGIKIYKPNTAASARTDAQVAAYYLLKNAKFDSQSSNAAIGDNRSVTMNFSSQLGGPQDLTKGLFLSGIHT